MPSHSADSVRRVRSTVSSPRLRRVIVAYTINRLGTWFGAIALSLAVIVWVAALGMRFL